MDGFIVNHAPASKAGVQSNPFVADSVGEFIGVVWENQNAATGETHIRGQFYDVIGNFDEFIPNAIDISDGIGNEFNAALVSGGANSGWGATWEQRDSVADVSSTLRTNFVGPGQMTGPEISVFNEGELVDQHDAGHGRPVPRPHRRYPRAARPRSASIRRRFRTATPWCGSRPIWTARTARCPAGYGRIMMQNFEVPLDPLGNPQRASRGRPEQAARHWCGQHGRAEPRHRPGVLGGR